MKKILLIVAALFVAVSFSSCDKDDYKNTLIVGNWQLVWAASYDLIGGWEEWPNPERTYLNLDANGYGTTNFGSSSEEQIKYKLTDSELFITYISEGDYADSWDVSKLSDSELILEWQDTESERKQALTFNRK